MTEFEIEKTLDLHADRSSPVTGIKTKCSRNYYTSGKIETSESTDNKQCKQIAVDQPRWAKWLVVGGTKDRVENGDGGKVKISHHNTQQFKLSIICVLQISQT